MSGVLDLVIGIAFLYLLLSLIVTTINEIIAAIGNSRGQYLFTVIRGLVEDEAIAKSIEGHGLVRSIVNNRLPSYIPSRSFALALLDAISRLDQAKIRTKVEIEQALNSIQVPSLRTTLLALYADAENDVNRFVDQIEQWFNGGMERARAWYKRNTQYCTIAIAGLLVVGLNVDTIRVCRVLSNDGTKREIIAAEAYRFVKSHSTPRPSEGASGGEAASGQGENPTSPKDLRPLFDELNAEFPIGWTRDDLKSFCQAGVGGWVLWLLGCLLTVLAVSLGAPFWFDVLGKIANVRFNGQPPGSASAPTKALG